MTEPMKRWLIQKASELAYALVCLHGGEPWYCDCCRHEWEKRVAAVQREMLAKAQEQPHLPKLEQMLAEARRQGQLDFARNAIRVAANSNYDGVYRWLERNIAELEAEHGKA